MITGETAKTLRINLIMDAHPQGIRGTKASEEIEAQLFETHKRIGTRLAFLEDIEGIGSKLAEDGVIVLPIENKVEVEQLSGLVLKLERDGRTADDETMSNVRGRDSRWVPWVEKTLGYIKRGGKYADSVLQFNLNSAFPVNVEKLSEDWPEEALKHTSIQIGAAHGASVKKTLYDAGIDVATQSEVGEPLVEELESLGFDADSIADAVDRRLRMLEDLERE